MTSPTWRITWHADTPETAHLNGPGAHWATMHPRAAAKYVLRHGADRDALIWIDDTGHHPTTVGAYRAVVRRRKVVLALKVIAAILLVLALAAPIAGWL